MENLTLLTKENIDNYNITELDRLSMLSYMTDSVINLYSTFQFAVDEIKGQIYLRYIMLGKAGEWSVYKNLITK